MAPETAVVKAKRAPPAHPPFVEMITEAIVALKERTGSSQYAITKYVEEKHKQLPQSFKKLLLLNLKKLVASGKLVKVKASFKLPPRSSAPAVTSSAPAKVKTTSKPVASKSKKSATAAKTNAAKPKAKTVVKSKAAAKSKPTAAKPVKKAARTTSRTSPGKKAEAKSKAVAKKAKSVKSPVKKPKSVKSPAKKKVQPKRGKK